MRLASVGGYSIFATFETNLSDGLPRLRCQGSVEQMIYIAWEARPSIDEQQPSQSDQRLEEQISFLEQLLIPLTTLSTSQIHNAVIHHTLESLRPTPTKAYIELQVPYMTI